MRRQVSRPDVVGFGVKCGNDCIRSWPCSRMTPHEPRSARAEHPFMRACNEEITSGLVQTDILYTQCMDPVDTEQDPILLRPPALISASRSPMCWIGSFNPVPECTHVTARTRVRAVR